MITITNSENCCGCTACYNICPQKSIKMQSDFEGFLYPIVNLKTCINCGLCEKVCPIINYSIPNNDFIREAYILRSKEDETLINSTSGGFFTPLSKWVLDNNGIVYGAIFDQNFKVIHGLATKECKENTNMFKGSKYVQSDLKECFFEIKNFLNLKRMVCFSGTPCQISGLKQYLQKEYENLILVDVVCHGVPSPKLWHLYLEYQQSKFGSKIKNVNFRNKTYGYHSGTMKIIFENNFIYYGSARVDFMLKSFFSEISSRPSCYSCKFKNIIHDSDFLIFDCWNAEKLVPRLKDDDKGYTNIIVQTKKGQQILEKIRDNFFIYNVDLDKTVELDGIMINNSAKKHEKREQFYLDIEKCEFEKHIKKFLKITQKDYFLEKSKKIFYKFKIIKLVRSIKK